MNAASLLSEVTRDRFAGYPHDGFIFDRQVPFRDMRTKKIIYPLRTSSRVRVISSPSLSSLSSSLSSFSSLVKSASIPSLSLPLDWNITTNIHSTNQIEHFQNELLCNIRYHCLLMHMIQITNRDL